MLKVIYFFLLCTLLTKCTYTNSKEGTTGRNFEYLTQDTSSYLPQLQEILYLEPLLAEFRNELPHYLEYIQYLNKDSVKGISIDFAGMIHSTTFDDNHPQLAACQDEIYKLFKRYDFLGCEGFSGFGIITKEDFVQQQVLQFKTYYADIVDTALVNSQAMRQALENEAGFTAVFRHILSKDSNIIASDASVLNIIQERLGLLSQAGIVSQSLAEWDKLTDIRSELALAKVIAYIKQNRLQNKKVLMVYGYGHFAKFKELVEKLNISSTFTTPPQCLL